MENNIISKIELEELLKKNLSTRKIGKMLNINYKKILALVKKYELSDLLSYKKPIYNTSYFSNIDTPEKAYILGFLLGDSHLCDSGLNITIGIQDKEFVYFMKNEIGGNPRESYEKNVQKKIFPHITLILSNPSFIRDLMMLFGGYLKEDRHIPIIKKSLQVYLLRGFFDAEGCITFGYRKDRNRLWHKISFTSQYKMLEGIQKMLINFNISSSIKPKSKCNCFVMDICSKTDVIRFYENVYKERFDIGLSRKLNKFKEVMRIFATKSNELLETQKND